MINIYIYNVIYLKSITSNIKKYKLDKEFEFMDNLRTSIQTTLKHQEIATKRMLTLVLNAGNKQEDLEEEASEEVASEE